MKLEIDPQCFAREFEEVDEKLPSIAQEVVLRGIDFQMLDTEDAVNTAAFSAIMEILQDSLECFHEMTEDDINSCIEQLLVSCELVCLVNDGIVEECDGGKYRLTEKGIQLAKKNNFA